MTRRDPRVRLLHMLDFAREALTFLRGRIRADLDTDRLLNLAHVRLAEMIGEAAAQTPAETRGQIPEIEWSQIVGLRNRLVHGCDSVNFDTLWDILTNDIPPLVAALEQALSSDANERPLITGADLEGS